MANLLKFMARKTLFSGKGNLVSFDEPYARIAKLLQGTRVTGIVDAGASNGRISRRFLRLFPSATVYGFEPNPLYAETLKKFAAGHRGFSPQFLALTEKGGMAELFITSSPGTTSLFQPEINLTGMYPEGSQVEKVEKVRAVSLDEWAEEAGAVPIQVMKFDIQGGELNALKGAEGLLRKTVALIYTEILFNPLYEGGALFSEIDLCLRKPGFVLYDIYKPRHHRDGRLLWANAIYIHPDRVSV